MASLPVLDFDLGNTRLKWRFQSPEQEQSGASDYGTPGLDAPDLPAGLLPARIRIASVVTGPRLQQILTLCRDRWGLEPELARVQPSCAGVSHGYRDGSRLGVDRWLATLAAFNRVEGACVVVSCGTAITVDPVTASGRHLGGYIVPGIELMRRSLFEGTDRVKVEEIDWTRPLSPGDSTEVAVNHGLAVMVSGLVETAGRLLREQGDEPTIIISGGDGALLQQHLLPRAQLVPQLVFEGLALALP